MHHDMVCNQVKAKINIYKDTVGTNLFEQAQLFPVHVDLKVISFGSAL